MPPSTSQPARRPPSQPGRRPVRPPRRAVVATALALLVTLWPAVARAEMFWPGLVLEYRLLTWWAAGTGLVLEAAYLWWRLRPAASRRALGYSAWMNTVSAALGIILIPLGTFLGMIPLSALVPSAGATDTHYEVMNVAAWIATAPLATAINAAVEWWTLRHGFGLTLPGRAQWELAAVNAVTVLLAMASRWARPIA